MKEAHYYPKGAGKKPLEDMRFRPEQDTSLVDVVKEFMATDASYEHQPGYFGSVEVVLVERKPEHPSPRVEDTEATQPYSIH